MLVITVNYAFEMKLKQNMTMMQFLSLMLFVTYIYPSSTFTGFRKEPQNDRQPEGGTAYFTCIVIGLNNVEYVTWIHDGKEITEDGRIVDKDVDERYMIDSNALLGTFNLHIRNIQRKDKGHFVCTVFSRENHLVAESKPANLTVLQIPRKHYPMCSPISNYVLGQNVVVTCISEITEPLAHLTWKHNEVDVTSQVETFIDTDDYRVSYSLIVSKSDQRSIFTCEMTTPANPAIRRNCSSGPFNILYAPHVRIEQTDVVMLGKEAIFICYSDSNPPEVTFEWTFNPPIDESMYVLENDRILRILNTQTNMNGTSIICKATNSIGSQSQAYQIIVFNYSSKDGKTLSEHDNIKKGNEENNQEAGNEKTNSKHKRPQTIAPDMKHHNEEFSVSLIVAIAVACIVAILGLALIPVGYMRYTRRQPSDAVSRGRPVSIPDVYFEPKDHVDPMLPQLGLSVPWMRTVGVQVPGECEYDVTYTQVSPRSRQAYYSQRMYTAASL